jgi:hypothetical protein
VRLQEALEFPRIYRYLNILGIRRQRGKGQEGWAVGVKCSKAINESEITRSLRVSENLQDKKGDLQDKKGG